MIRPRSLRALVTAVPVAAVALASCAQQGAPPGGPEDRRPPVVVRTVPDTYAVVEDFRGPVRFVFDERISERVSGSLDDLVLVSPRTGAVRVDLGRQEVSVDIDGGFQPGRAYRITLQPAVSDLFNNQLRDPFELVFSTGGEFHPTAIAGFAWDRLTGQGMDDAVVQVRPVDEADSATVHVARADTGGLYALRYVPPGRYLLTAFVDRNRDGEPGGGEPVGRANFAVGPADTVLADVPLLAPDTTPAVVTGVEILDSVTLIVRFDDALDPAVPVRSIGIGIQPDSGAADSVEAPGVRQVEHVWEYNRRIDALADSFARLDSLEAAARAEEARAEALAARARGDTVAPVDTAAAGRSDAAPDSVVARDTLATPDSVAGVDEAEPRLGPVRRLPPRVPPAAGRGRPGVGGAPAGRGDRPAPVPVEGAPSRDGPFPEARVVALLDAPLPVNQPFRLLVTGVRNINGLPLGGGQAAFVRSPPPPDSAAADSTTADTLAVDGRAADTLAADTILPDSIVPDTVPPAPVVPDTIAADTIPPDTIAGAGRGSVEGVADRTAAGSRPGVEARGGARSRLSGPSWPDRPRRLRPAPDRRPGPSDAP